MSKIIQILPVGRINRRDLVSEIDDDQVLSRENFAVIGSKNKKLKKLPGSDRFNSSSFTAGPTVWGYRYYTKSNKRKTFFFNQGDGSIYHISDAGVLTQDVSIFSHITYPCAEEMRVSGVDQLFFSEGVNTGMYSYDGNDSNHFIKETSVTLNFVGMVSWLDRMWGFEEDSEDLYFSANLNPTDYTNSTDAGMMTIGAKRGSKIQQIIVDNETLYIFKEDGIYYLDGKSPYEFAVRELTTELGLVARRSLKKVESGMVFLASDYEFYSFGGTQNSLKMLTYDLSIGGDRTKDLVPIINRDRMEPVCATYHNKIYRCSFCENGQVTNNLEYCFSSINETDWLTRDNNVSCYIPYTRHPDLQELVTGRSDAGYLMYQYRGLNWDNQATSPTMPIKIQTKFIGYEEPRNLRVKRVWINTGSALGSLGIPVKIQLDSRLAESSMSSNTFPTQGETKNLTNSIKINNQSVISSRQIMQHNASKGQNFSLLIDENINNRDFEFSSFGAEVISKNVKRSEKIGV